MTTLDNCFPIGSEVSITGHPATFKDTPAVVVGYDRDDLVVNFPSHYDPKANFTIRPEDAFLIDKQVRVNRATLYLDKVISEIDRIGASPEIIAVVNELNKAFSHLILVPELICGYQQAVIDCVNNTEIHSRYNRQIYLAMVRNGVEIELFQFETAFVGLLSSGKVFYSEALNRWFVSEKTLEQEQVEIEVYLGESTGDLMKDESGNPMPMPLKSTG